MIQRIFTWINSVAASGITFAIRVHCVAIMLPEFTEKLSEPEGKGSREDRNEEKTIPALLLMHIVLYKQIHTHTQCVCMWVNIQCIRIQNEAQWLKTKTIKMLALLKCVLAFPFRTSYNRQFISFPYWQFKPKNTTPHTEYGLHSCPRNSEQSRMGHVYRSNVLVQHGNGNRVYSVTH